MSNKIMFLRLHEFVQAFKHTCRRHPVSTHTSLDRLRRNNVHLYPETGYSLITDVMPSKGYIKIVFSALTCFLVAKNLSRTWLPRRYIPTSELAALQDRDVDLSMCSDVTTSESCPACRLR